MAVLMAGCEPAGRSHCWDRYATGRPKLIVVRRASRRRWRVAGASQRETENAKVRTSSLGSRSDAGLNYGRSASIPPPDPAPLKHATSPAQREALQHIDARAVT